MNSEDLFLTDFDHDFNTTLIDGTIGDPPQPIDDFIDPDIMTGNTYTEWLNRIKTTAQDTYNVDTSLLINDIKVYQITPWFVNVDADLSFNVSSETASWNKTATIKTEISVEKFDDPYYLVKTGGAYYNKINKSNVKFDEWHIENVTDHIKYGTYVHWENSDAPSFLQRFIGDTSASSCCGIESLVNRDKLVG
ncbi:MAG: hypothetical protein IIB81_03315, partial [Nanoarchaeota archaeon]|nr:hypothetical protein [Nanoarchaeota archaeon]